MIRGIRFLAAKMQIQKQDTADVISFSQVSSCGNVGILLRLIHTVPDHSMQWLWEGGEDGPWTGDTLADGLYDSEPLRLFLERNAHQSLETGGFFGVPTGTDPLPAAKPQTYAEFLASPFQIALIFCDTFYFDIYVKDPALAGKMFIAMETIAAEISELEYITDENDERTGLSPF